MDFLKKFDLTGVQFLKLIALILLGLGVLFVLLNILTSNFGIGGQGVSFVNTPSINSRMEYDTATELSLRNVAESPMMQNEGGATGNESEAFEIKEYNAHIETRNLNKDCESIRALKGRTDVIFENATEYTRGCNFTFKVEKKSVEDVLGIIKNLHPRELTENSFTIKGEVDDYTSEIQILENKLASLDKTLVDAIQSYESITLLASRAGNVESLAKIIESKLTIIERLTTARIETSNQLERMLRSKNEALDRLLYTYFSVNVYENTFVNSEDIKDSWKRAVQEFVQDANNTVQDLSIGLIAFILFVIKVVCYFILLLLVSRFGWMFAKKVWMNNSGV